MSRNGIEVPPQNTNSLPRLAIGAIGVVFGDIGTSPIYTFRESMNAAGGATSMNILGTVSLILWAIILVVTVKYVLLVMRADNDGEGGILALAALTVGVSPARFHKFLVLLGIIGAAMFYGDSMLTPAISVISAVEGLTIIDTSLQVWIVPISIALLTCLFLLQKRGTGTVGTLFGPVMILWFLTLAVLGIRNIVHCPQVIRAVSPFYAINLLKHSHGTAAVILGSAFLALTGGEALYADMGHFGKRALRHSWMFFVFPCLILNYFGQAALLLVKPSALTQPFFASAPPWALPFLVLLATAATVIASQAVLSGAFSMTQQAVQLGVLPRVRVVHTSSRQIGQVYVPSINLVLYIAVVFLTTAFKSSDRLASAYGIAVASTMLTTTVLLAFVVFYRWRSSIVGTIAVILPCIVLDGTFMFCNSMKILDGGWIPLVIGASIVILMTTWNSGRQLVVKQTKSASTSLLPLVQALERDSMLRIPGTAVFPFGIEGIAPTAFLHNLKHNGVIHSTNLFMSWRTASVPFLSDSEKVSVSRLSSGCYAIEIIRGFMEEAHVPTILGHVESHIEGWKYDAADVSFFLDHSTVVASQECSYFHSLRTQLFSFLRRNAEQATEYASLPASRVVELGGQISL